MDPKNDSEEDSSSSMSKDNKRSRAEGKGSDTTLTNDRSSTSDSVSETKTMAKHSRRSSSQSQTRAADSAASSSRRSKKKPRRAGFREKFLQQLRVLLDRESHIESNIVQWSTDGNSFIIMDQSQFESDIIPTYFDNPTVFPNFLNKLSRWGFKRVSNKETGCIEFCSPTFSRLNAFSSAPAAATDTSNEGGDDSMQQQRAEASPLEAMAQSNQLPQPNRNQQPSQVAAVVDLISNIQRLSQQLNMPSQQSPLHQHPNPPESDVNGVLQSIIGTLQRTLDSQLHSNQIPPNLYNNFVGGQLSSSHMQGFPQGSAVNPLMNLSGMLSQQSYPNRSSAASMSHPNNNMAVQSLMILLHRVGEEERQRRAQADALQNVIIANIVQIIGLSSNMDDQERQRGLESSGIPTGTTEHVPHNISFQSQQVGRSSSTAANPNAQALGSARMAAILQALQQGAGQLGVEIEHDRGQSNGPDNSNSNSGDNEDDSNDSEPSLSRGKKSSPDGDDSAEEDDRGYRR